MFECPLALTLQKKAKYALHILKMISYEFLFRFLSVNSDIDSYHNEEYRIIVICSRVCRMVDHKILFTLDDKSVNALILSANDRNNNKSHIAIIAIYELNPECSNWFRVSSWNAFLRNWKSMHESKGLIWKCIRASNLVIYSFDFGIFEYLAFLLKLLQVVEIMNLRTHCIWNWQEFHSLVWCVWWLIIDDIYIYQYVGWNDAVICVQKHANRFEKIHLICFVHLKQWFSLNQSNHTSSMLINLSRSNRFRKKYEIKIPSRVADECSIQKWMKSVKCRFSKKNLLTNQHLPFIILWILDLKLISFIFIAHLKFHNAFASNSKRVIPLKFQLTT